jgi:hypothetical protein
VHKLGSTKCVVTYIITLLLRIRGSGGVTSLLSKLREIFPLPADKFELLSHILVTLDAVMDWRIDLFDIHHS